MPTTNNTDTSARIVCRANCGTPQQRRMVAANLTTWARAQAQRKARNGDAIVRKVRKGSTPKGLRHSPFAEVL